MNDSKRLERWRNHFPTVKEEWLSDTSAQPAAPTAETEKAFPVCSTCLKPMQCLTDNEDDRHPLWACVDGSYCGEPAAPEPSVCALFSGCEGSGYATILGTGGDAAPCEECKLGKVYKRAESAEARLAAVRRELSKDGFTGDILHAIQDMLAAPPGEGSKT